MNDLEFIEILIKHRKEVIEENKVLGGVVDYAKENLQHFESIKKKLLAWELLKDKEINFCSIDCHCGTIPTGKYELCCKEEFSKKEVAKIKEVLKNGNNNQD